MARARARKALRKRQIARRYVSPRPGIRDAATAGTRRDRRNLRGSWTRGSRPASQRGMRGPGLTRCIGSRRADADSATHEPAAFPQRAAPFITPVEVLNVALAELPHQCRAVLR